MESIQDKYGKLKYKVSKKEHKLRSLEDKLAKIESKIQHDWIEDEFESSLQHTTINAEHLGILWSIWVEGWNRKFH